MARFSEGAEWPGRPWLDNEPASGIYVVRKEKTTDNMEGKMKRLAVSALAALVATLLAVSGAPAVEHYGGQGALPGQMPGIGQTEGAQTGAVHSASSLIGLSVEDQQGQQLGQLQDVMVDLNQNQIAYGILEVEGSRYLVPWAAITSDHQGIPLTLNADRQTVVAAPVAPAPEMIDENLGRQVHEHFGVSPYWEGQEFRQPTQQPMFRPEQNDPALPRQ
jgi:sporulation protein YlmC with PRC-barrel domain